MTHYQRVADMSPTLPAKAVMVAVVVAVVVAVAVTVWRSG